MTFDIDPNLLHTWQVIDGVLCGEYPNNKEPSKEKAQALVDAGINVFIDLSHPNDGLAPYAPLLSEINPDIIHHHFSIPDNGVRELDFYVVVACVMYFLLQSNNKIYLHCWGGMGRSATVMACLMRILDSKMTSSKAIEMIDIARENTSKGHLPAPEPGVQVNIVREFYDYCNKQSL